MKSDSINITKLKEILEELILDENPHLTEVLAKFFNEIALAEREQFLGCLPYERSEVRKDYSNGFKNKTYHTRSGPIKVKVPQVRHGLFYPTCLEKGCRSERALKLGIAEMFIKGVSTRKVTKLVEETFGMDISSNQVSRLTKMLDEELQKFRERPLGRIKYVFVDAHYEKVRHGGSVVDLAVLKAIGVDHEGYREILGVSVDLSEAEVHWRSFFSSLVKRGLHGVELIVSDDHPGLKASLRSVFPSVPWQRCTFHMSQNAQNYAPKKSMKGEIGNTMRAIFSSSSKEIASLVTQESISKYEKSAPDFSYWLENNIEEGLRFLEFPEEHWKKIRTVNMVERLNQEIRRRTRVARLFPNKESCLRLVTAILQEKHEEWSCSKKYMR